MKTFHILCQGRAFPLLLIKVAIRSRHFKGSEPSVKEKLKQLSKRYLLPWTFQERAVFALGSFRSSSLKNMGMGAPGWFSRLSARLRLRSWSCWVWVRAPCLTLSLEPASDSVSPSLSALPPCSHSASLSKINSKNVKNQYIFKKILNMDNIFFY